jgi:hypothetical protein
MYSLLIFKTDDQKVNTTTENFGYDNLEVHFIYESIESDQYWIKLYNVTEFPTFVLLHDRKETDRTSKINYESDYDIKCWIRNAMNYEQEYD